MTHYRKSEALDPQHELLQHYTLLLAQLLVNRGMNTTDQATMFLDPIYETHDPFLLYNMDISIERFYQAIKNNEKITLYADYDADGIPGAVALFSLLEKIGYDNHDVYLPHRHDEGYGIHLEALEKIKTNRTGLIITIDVGITAHEAAQWSLDNHIDMIITDHHLPLENQDGSQNLPQPFALINPKQSLCHYPDSMLCGAGVIFKFIQAFVQKHGDEFSIHTGWEKWLLDMVGIATLSDMVPLRNENRVFGYYGMKVIQKTKRMGLKKLLWDAGINIHHITEEDITFSITPKINAASRMSHPEDAFSLFTAQNEVQAETAMKHLVGLNNERKKLVASTMKKAYAKLEKRNIGNVIVVGSPDWQAGILGLVASKLVEKYQKTAFVWSEEHGEIKGSCRSYNGTHLVELMSSASPESFIQFGGHKEAGGFTCKKSEIHFLEERLCDAFDVYQKTVDEYDEEVGMIDMSLTLDEITIENYRDLRKLAPFGVDNPKPLFIFENVIPIEIAQFGKTKEHLEVHFKNSLGKTIRALAFFAEPSIFTKTPTRDHGINLIAHMDYSVFRGNHELRLRIVDFI